MDTAVRFLRAILPAVAFGVCLSACGPIGGKLTTESSSQPGTGDPSSEMYKPSALLWEGQNKDGLLWSAYTYQIIGNDVAAELLPGTDDMSAFCPNYPNMTAPEKINFWAYLVSALAKYASNFDPASRAVAGGMDIITNRPAYAEGLLHLSYRDIQNYTFCAFDWDHDKDLSATDIARTILDPVKNLDCGIKILATQIEKTKKIALSSGGYWNLLSTAGSGNKVKSIEQLTSQLPFCRAP